MDKQILITVRVSLGSIIPSSLTAPVATSAKDPRSWISSTFCTIAASYSSSNSSPLRSARPLRTIDITPAICFGPITAIFAVGQRNVNLFP